MGLGVGLGVGVGVGVGVIVGVGLGVPRRRLDWLMNGHNFSFTAITNMLFLHFYLPNIIVEIFRSVAYISQSMRGSHH